MTEKQLQEKYLRRYTEIFEKAYKSPALHDLLSHDDEKIGFATPLITNGESMKRDVLFVGINPSFNKKDEKADLFNASSTVGAEKDYLSFSYGLNGFRSNERYYGKIVTIAEKAGLDSTRCGYLDLFVYRKREQKQLDQILKTPDGVEFMVSQIEVFYEIVTQLVKPKLIVVLNAQAQNFLGLKVRYKNGEGEKDNVWLGLETKAIEGSLIHEITGCKPILSDDFNQRALDLLGTQKIYILPFRFLSYVRADEYDKLIFNIAKFKEKHLF